MTIPIRQTKITWDVAAHDLIEAQHYKHFVNIDHIQHTDGSPFYVPLEHVVVSGQHSPFQVSAKLPQLDPGVHTLTVISIDEGSDIDSKPTTITITINTPAAPSIVSTH